MIYLLSIAFTFLFLMYQKYQFQDLKTFRNIEWKKWGWLMKSFFILACFLSQFFAPSWKDCLLSGALMWVIFELGYNKIVLINAPWLYVGESSMQDILLGKSKWVIMAIFLIFSVWVRFGS